jgi:hypothetical protein
MILMLSVLHLSMEMSLLFSLIGLSFMFKFLLGVVLRGSNTLRLFLSEVHIKDYTGTYVLNLVYQKFHVN